MKPGIYSNLSNAQYHGGAGISKSSLDLIRRSPLHFKAAQQAANDNQPTPAQMIGTAFHTLVLEPEKFDDDYVLPFVAPEGALNTIEDLKAVLKAAGEKVSGTKPELIERVKAIQPDAVILDELKHQYAISNAGRTILTQEAWDQLNNMRLAVMAHPAARALLTTANNVVVDVKTCEDASPEGFARSIAKWSYHVQHAFYLDVLKLALEQSGQQAPEHGTAELSVYADCPETGHLLRVRPDFWRGEPKHFVFLAVEKTARVVDGKALGVAVYRLDNESVELGRLQYKADLAKYDHCVQNDVWPCYGEAIQSITLPAWHAAQTAQKLDSAA